MKQPSYKLENISRAAISGVTGNPGGSDPLAKSIRRINFTSGSDPPLDQFH